MVVFQGQQPLIVKVWIAIFSLQCSVSILIQDYNYSNPAKLLFWKLIWKCWSYFLDFNRRNNGGREMRRTRRDRGREKDRCHCIVTTTISTLRTLCLDALEHCIASVRSGNAQCSWRKWHLYRRAEKVAWVVGNAEAPSLRHFCAHPELWQSLTCART